MSESSSYDVVIYGASGFTGRLIVEYMARQYPNGAGVAWAVAARNAEKMKQVLEEVGAPSDTPIIIADADDPSTLDAMAASAKVICTTVGPYQLYGEPLVAACAKAGTAYVDLCGEPAWMRKMIDKYDDQAKASGARIVFSCGFDSIPFDMGVYFLQEHAKEKLGSAVQRVKGRVRAMNGGFSGGTAASLTATMAAAAKDPSILELLRTPFCLTPGFTGADQPSGMKPKEEEAVGSWVAPFIMAPINTKNVHRSNLLLNHAYGEDFVYDEMVLTGPGEEGKQRAKAMATANPLAGEDMPKPGEGPSKEEREKGNYDVLFIGESDSGETLKASVSGTEDPGYASTSKMIAECAVCLTKEAANLPGGIYTTAPAFGTAIIDRLTTNAGLTFKLE